jgi:hypothetical protein
MILRLFKANLNCVEVDQKHFFCAADVGTFEPWHYTAPRATGGLLKTFLFWGYGFLAESTTASVVR